MAWTWTSLILVIILLQGTHEALGFQAYVCSPANKTEPLACTEGQWIRIDQEFYAAKHSGLDCQVNLTACNNVVYSYGLEASCNGPVTQDTGPCEEEVDMDREKERKDCFKDVDVMAAIVEYTCLPPSSVIDMCEDQTLSLQTNNIHLVSPGFPNTDQQRQMCSCSIQGTTLNMNAVDLNIRGGLAWTEDKNDSSIPTAVLEVTNDEETLWSSNNCQGCEELILHNTNMFRSTQSTIIDLVFADFGLPGQKVWLSLFDHGTNLNISCTSSPLPSSRIITTTTTTTTTTPPTTTTIPTTTTPPTTTTIPTTTTPPTTTTTPTTTTPLTTTTTPTTTTSPTTTTTPPTTIPATTTKNPTTTTSTSTTSTTTEAPPILTDVSTKATSTPLAVDTGPPGAKGKGPRKEAKDDGGDGNAPMIVGLVLFLLVLIGVAIVLGIFIYKKRDKFASTNFKPPLWPWLKRCFSRRENQYMERGGHDETIYTYDNQIYGQYPIDAENNGASNDVILRQPIKAGEKSVDSHEELDESTEYDTDSWNSRKFENDNDPNRDPISLVNTQTYANHQAIVGEEVARIKTERKKKASNEKLNKTHDGKNDSGSGDDNRNNMRGKNERRFDHKASVEKDRGSNSDNNGTNLYTDNPVRSSVESDSDKTREKDKNNSAGKSKSHGRHKKDREDGYFEDKTTKNAPKQKDSKQEGPNSSTQNWPVLSSEEGRMFEALGIAKGAEDNQEMKSDTTITAAEAREDREKFKHSSNAVDRGSSKSDRENDTSDESMNKELQGEGDLKKSKKEKQIENILSNSLRDIRDKLRSGSSTKSSSEFEAGEETTEC